MKALIFLDFDGVLHPLWSPAPFNDWQLEATFGPTPYAGPFFVHAAALVEILSPYLEELEVVVSSTWGRERSIEDLQALLPAPLAARVLDAVHHHLPPTKQPRSRWGEISWYLENVRPDHADRWLAVDDDDRGWPGDQGHHLVLCRRDLGDPSTRGQLQAALASWCNP